MLAIAALCVLPLLVGAALVSGVLGGLLRAGAIDAAGVAAPWLGQSAASHAALMICGFFGAVISIERAVAVRLRVAFAVPLAAGLGALCLLLGQARAGASLFIAASLGFVLIHGILLRRQPAAHVVVLLAGALCWLAGNLAFLEQAPAEGVIACWFAFLVTTIAAERLEMTRLTRAHVTALPLLALVLAAMVSGALLSLASRSAGGVLFGSSMLLLAAWLFVFDVARRTVRARGLSRYMAVGLLAGYGWLAVGGVAWIGMALGCPARDAALHALALGFVFSMVMAHAPVILPAVARVKLHFDVAFYIPLAVLHLSLAMRLLSPAGPARALAASLNAAAIALFLLTLLGSALVWRARHREIASTRMSA